MATDRATRRARQPLSEEEKVVLRALMSAADAGCICPTSERLLDYLPERSSVSHVVELVQTLEARGIIKVDRYQRARRVTILSSGKATAMPSSTSPHWRTRPKVVPSPASHVVQQRKPDAAAAIFAEARRLGKHPQDFLCDLVWAGWEQHVRDSSDPAPTLRAGP